MTNKALLPNLITLSSVASAMIGILFLGISGLSTGEKPYAVAMLCLCLSQIFDRIDGPLARKLGVTSPLGAQLDTLADLIAFGVLPAAFLAKFLSTTGPLELIQISSATVFVCAAAWRLARFSETGLVKTRFGECFVGIPTPVAGAALSAAIVASVFWPIFPMALVIFTFVLAALMNAPLLYPKRGIGAWPWFVILPLSLAAIWYKAFGHAAYAAF